MSKYDCEYNIGGGPAFPSESVEVVSDTHDPMTGELLGLGSRHVPHPGMTLRDYIATKAMNGMLSSAPSSEDWPDHKDIASRAYRYADAMLRAREL